MDRRNLLAATMCGLVAWCVPKGCRAGTTAPPADPCGIIPHANGIWNGDDLDVHVRFCAQCRQLEVAWVEHCTADFPWVRKAVLPSMVDAEDSVLDMRGRCMAAVAKRPHELKCIGLASAPPVKRARE